MTQKQIVYAGLQIRLFATIIDTVLSVLILAPILQFITNLTLDKDRLMEVYSNLASGTPLTIEEMGLVQQYFYSNIAQLAVMSIVVLIFWSYKGGTPGKMILRLKIVSARDLTEPTTTQFIIRYFGYILSFIPFCLGFFWIAVDEKHQAWHDKMSRTVVIKT